jgi:DNA polymerase-3 subunit gamma/tau
MLSYPALHRLWQLLLKGHDEVARAALPIEAGEMALLRVVHASSLPDPGELARQIASGIAPTLAPPTAGAAPPPASAPLQTLPPTFEAMVELVRAHGGGSLLSHLNANARVVRYDPPELVLSTSRPLPADLPAMLAARLGELTPAKWKVTTEDAEGEATLADRRKADDEAERATVMETPIVKAALEAFPGATLERINKEAQAS